MYKITYPRLGRRRREHQSISTRYTHTYNVGEPKRSFETKQWHQNRMFLKIVVTEKTTIVYNMYPATRYTQCALQKHSAYDNREYSRNVVEERNICRHHWRLYYRCWLVVTHILLYALKKKKTYIRQFRIELCMLCIPKTKLKKTLILRTISTYLRCIYYGVALGKSILS